MRPFAILEDQMIAMYGNKQIKIKFLPGQIVVTQGALNLLKRHKVLPDVFLIQHLQGKWGDVSPEDADQNDVDLEDGGRLLSVYTVYDEKLLLLTEADRSISTFLLPDDY